MRSRNTSHVLVLHADGVAPTSSSASPGLHKKLSRKNSVLFAFENIFAKDRKTHEKDDEHAPLCGGSFPSSDMPPPKTPRIPAALRSQQSFRLLRVYHLIGITFFAVTSGPFGFEGTVGAVGPVLMQIGLLLFQVLWSAPLALMTAELSCMIPLTGGHVLWIYRAFGPFWSFVNSCFAFTCSVLDNALYAVLFVEYLSSLLYGNNHSISHAWSIAIRILLIVLVTVLNITGIRIIGIAALVLMAAVLSPFAAMLVWGLPRLNFNWIHGQTPKHIDLGKFITLLLWNSSGFDGAGNIASEVESPASSYPRALAASVLLILAVYGLPTLIGVSVLPDYNEWKSGAYMSAAKLIGGHPLQIWMGLSEVLSAVGLLLTRICINSRVIYGMTLVEQVPVFTWLHPRFGTPWIAILTTSILTLLLAEFNFYSLAEADMLFYALSTMLKFCALVQLRFTEPDAFRPFWIPLSRNILAGLMLIPIGLCLSMLYFASNRSQVIGLIGMLAAVMGYSVKELLPQYGKKAEEVTQQRVTRVQQNIDRMQQWIDLVIAKEFKMLQAEGSSANHGLELYATRTNSEDFVQHRDSDEFRSDSGEN
ncbi:hypothetical protein GOP47_0022959 [Adiantum capillus-veneris]|uniref:Uncharacterized protein n=1 Tax=Adiantum capillus-veneris TaxID=13818 RepID=A0A9D4U6U4_ADICA|nr:hypothetical protein GOP47_0022959 [Adiantum capillus-veneris]